MKKYDLVSPARAAGILFILLFSNFLFAQVAPTGSNFTTAPVNFNIDGRLVGTSTTTGDWLKGTVNNPYVFDNDGEKLSGLLAYHIVDSYLASDKIFDGANRATDAISAWKWKTGSATNKANLHHALLYVARAENGHTWGMFSADRQSPTGTTAIDFEFFQDRVDMTSPALSTGGFTGGRTIGDILVSVQFVGGSTTTAKILYYRWSGSTYDPITTTAQFAFAQVNTNSTIPVPYDAFGSTSYSSNQFIEGAIDISQLMFLGAGNWCEGFNFQTMLVKTKATDDLSGNLVDFATPIQFNPELSINSAAISYPSPFCQDISGNPNWQAVVFGQNSIETGTFTSTAGLQLNVSNGEIDIANSIPGNYIVTYHYVRNSECNITGTATTTVVIKPQIGTFTATITGANCGEKGSIQITDPEADVTYDLYMGAVLAGTATSTGLFPNLDPDTYSIVASKDGSCSATLANVVVGSSSALGAITGESSVCVDGSISLSNETSGGTWSSSDESIATVDGNGEVTGKADGQVTITYSKEGCSTTKSVTVNPLPLANAGTTPEPQCFDEGGNSFDLLGTVTNGTASWTVLTNTNSLTVDFGNAEAAETSVILSGGAGSVSLRLTASGACGTNTSDVTVTVYPSPSATISGGTTVCQGTTAPEISFTGSGGTRPYTFYYKIGEGATQSVTTTGANDSRSINQSTATAGTFTYTLLSVTDANCTGDISGQEAVISVAAASNGGTAGAAQTICYNTEPADLSLTGNIGDVLKWQKSVDAGFTSPDDIQSNSTTLQGATIGALTNDIWFRAVVQSGAGCATATSEAVKITVRPQLTAAIGGGATLCYGTGGTVTFTGSAGAIVTFNVSGGGTHSVTLDNSGTGSYATGNLTQSTTYSLGSVEYADAPACIRPISGSTVMNVREASSGGTAGAAQTICYNTTATVSVSGETGTITIWQSSLDNSTWNDISGTAGRNPYTTGNLTQTTWFRAVVQNGAGCATETSNSVRIGVYPLVQGGELGTSLLLSSSENTICAGTATTVILTNYVGVVIKWQKKVGSGSWTDISGTAGATTITTGNLDFGTYYYRAVVQGEGGCGTATSSEQTIQVIIQQICVTYNGDYFVNTNSTSTGGSAEVTLIWNIAGGAGPCNELSGLSASSFTITVGEKDASISNYELIQALTYSPTSSTVTAKYRLTLGTNQNSGSIEFKLGALGNYSIDESCEDNPYVTISTRANDFVTGGGFIIQSNTQGSTNAAVGTNGGTANDGRKLNFGFNVKWNKNMNNLLGNWTMVIRRTDAGTGTTLFQVKSSQPKTLAVTQVGNGYRADIIWQGVNLKNLTNGTSDGNATLQVTLFDNGEPGAGVDMLFLTVKDKTGAVWYTTDQSASHSITYSNYQLLNQGNMQIHTSGSSSGGGGKKNRMGNTSSEVLTATNLQLNAFPNPTHSFFKVQVQSENTSEKIELRVLDILGRTVETFNNLRAGETLQIGQSYPRGLYVIEMVQGDTRKQIKVSKQ